VSSDGTALLERASARPWSSAISAFAGVGLSVLADADGEVLGNLSAASDAALIVRAVNEYAALRECELRLRELVRGEGDLLLARDSLAALDDERGGSE